MVRPASVAFVVVVAVAVAGGHADGAGAQKGSSGPAEPVAAVAAVAPVAPMAPVAPPDSSLHRFVDELASSLEGRARIEKVVGNVRIEVEPSRGIDAAKVERAFTTRLKRRLKDGGVLNPVNDAPLRCRITISEEGGLVWATALLEGPSLIGPAAVATSSPVDRELEASLGAVVKPAQTRYVLERLGAVPAGVLDAALVDTDGDGVDELALLGVDGFRLFRVGAQRLERIGGLTPLESAAGVGAKKWPRVIAGWMARVDRDRLWAVTSAGHSVLWDPRTSRAEAGPPDLVPLRGTSSSNGPLAGGWRHGAPLVTLPLVSLGGGAVRTVGLPSRVRDVVQLPGAGGAWIFVDDQGQLIAQKSATSSSSSSSAAAARSSADGPTSLAGERVGDRLVLADLDGDGESDLLTTSASLPGEADHLVLRRLASDLSTSTVVFRSPLSGGSIAAAAAGRLDLSVGTGRFDVVLIEELGREALAWRLRYAP